jgi:hypothetical protein
MRRFLTKDKNWTLLAALTSQTGLLKVEQPTLDVEPSAISAERTARSDYPVTGDDDGDWIPVVRHADGSVGVSMADGFRDVAITPSLTVRNFEQRIPARKLKRSSAEIERERKLPSLAREVIVEFAKIGGQDLRRFPQLRRVGIQLLLAMFEFESYQAFSGSGEEQWTGRRRRTDVEQIFHDALEDSTILV